MSIKMQKIIRFIPVVNLITLIFLFKAYYCKPLKDTNFIKVMLMMFGVILAANLPRMVFHLMFENIVLNNIMYPVSLYVTLLGLSCIAVREQEIQQDD